MNSRYSAPILVNVEYIQGSNAQKNRVEKVLEFGDLNLDII